MEADQRITETIRKGAGRMKDHSKIKKWAKAALIRAIRTFGEAALAYIGTGALVLGDVDWRGVLSAGAFGFVSAWLLALKGLPEVDENE